MTQASRGRRRGAVFPIRVTDEERARLESYQRAGGGPRSLGPWLLWRALEAGPVQPDSRAGNTLPAIARVLPDLAPREATARHGNTEAGAAAVIPDRERSSGNTSAEGAPLPRPGNTRAQTPIAERVILDLCAGSGSWSQPYVDAGYPVERVSLPAGDVRVLPARASPVWGVLAAPPCEAFSLAANGHGSDFVRDFARALAVVDACLRTIWQVRPQWWALENPAGLLGRYLGTPRDVWEPCDFGDPWTKRTALWGDFELPKRGPFVEPRGSFTEMRHTPAARAVTPPGFARAFFEANP